MSVAQALEERHGIDLARRRDLVLTRGQGSVVFDDLGRSYIDCIAGHGAVSLGHSNHCLVDAIADQSRRLISCTDSFSNDTRARLLEALAQIAPAGLERSFLCNSGTEAVEAAIKFSRLTTGRSEIVSARRAFHGRSMGSLSATFNPKYRKGVGPLVPDFRFVSYNDEGALQEAVSERTAAVLLEPIQGEGGVHPATPDYLAAARRLCDDAGALLILDEVQTGFCRTGYWFACQHYDVVPDILCTAKGMGGGFPIGATICREDIDLPVGSHGTTFGGNPLACAAAFATINYMRKTDLCEYVRAKGEALFEAVRAIDSPIVRDIRGMGLMIGIDLRTPVRPVVERLLSLGVLALHAGRTVLRLLPPLTITEEELEKVTACLELALVDID